MRYQSFFVVLLLILSTSACNLPSSAPPTPTATPPSTATPVQPSSTPVPSDTPPPTNTPLPTLTFTPTVPVASPKEAAVNCRLGPGTAWLAVSALNIGQSAQIVGKNSDGSWWYIVDPFNSARNCWVSVSVTNAAGNLAIIPVLEAPKASVTNVSVKVDPTTITVGGCVGPITPVKITGTIETNGPAAVNWYFETQQGGAMSIKTTEFDTFGSKEVTAEFTPVLTAGSYWVRLIITSPTNIQAEAKYKIEC